MEPSIFTYADYRTYLLDAFRVKKSASRRWSFRAWSRQLGLASPSMLTMIVRGTRNPGDELTTRLCRHLQLPPPEESYFRDLVELQRVDGNERRSVLVMERLAQQRPTGEFRQLSRESFQAISRWHYYAIREMVSMRTFREDVDWITKRLQFRVTPGEVKDAIRTLVKLGLLERDEKGKLRHAGGHHEIGSDVANEAIKRFHEQALENARESVRLHAPPQRELYGTTVSLKREKLPQAKELIRKFHRDFSRLIDESTGQDTYQLEIAFYPLALEEDPS